VISYVLFTCILKYSLSFNLHLQAAAVTWIRSFVPVPVPAQLPLSLLLVVCGIICLYTMYHILHTTSITGSNTGGVYDTLQHLNVVVSCICVLLYWAVKYNTFTYFAPECVWCIVVCTYMYNVDWLIVLPRTVLALCSTNILFTLLCILHTSTTSTTHNIQYYQYILRQLLHTICALALVVGFMLGIEGSVVLVLCMVHSVGVVYCCTCLLNSASDCGTNTASTTSCSKQNKTTTTTKTSTTTTHTTQNTTNNTTHNTTHNTPALHTTHNTHTITNNNHTSIVVLLAIYFPTMGRFVYFMTGHRMDFGTLQVRVLLCNNMFCTFRCIVYVLCA